MWLLVDEFNSQYWWNYPHFFDTLEPLLYVQALPAPTIFGIFQLGWALFCSFSARSMGCNITCDYSWMNSTAWWTIPTSLTHWTVIVRTGSSSSNYFWYLSTRMGLTLLFLSARSMGCNVHVTTRGWIQLAVLVELSPFFDTLRPLLYVQALPAHYFGIFQLGWALTLCSFSARSNGL
jgi:hypothetical protein